MQADHRDLPGLSEQIDWRALRSRTRGSPYAAAFFVRVEELGVIPEEHVSHRAEVRVITPPPTPG
jgi:hypothetical protein